MDGISSSLTTTEDTTFVKPKSNSVVFYAERCKITLWLNIGYILIPDNNGWLLHGCAHTLASAVGIVDIGWLPMGLYLAWCIMNGINRMGRPMCKLLFMSIFSENHVRTAAVVTHMVIY